MCGMMLRMGHDNGCRCLFLGLGLEDSLGTLVVLLRTKYSLFILSHGLSVHLVFHSTSGMPICSVWQHQMKWRGHGRALSHGPLPSWLLAQQRDKHDNPSSTPASCPGWIPNFSPNPINAIVLPASTSDPTMDAELTQQILAAVAADRETVRRLVCDIPPTAEPVADYITDLDERCQLFDDLRQLHQQVEEEAPTAAMFAFVMVAPITEIQVLLSSFRNAPPHNRWQWVRSLSDSAAPRAMRDCMFPILQLALLQLTSSSIPKIYSNHMPQIPPHQTQCHHPRGLRSSQASLPLLTRCTGVVP